MFSTLSTIRMSASPSPPPAEKYGQNANYALSAPMLYFNYQFCSFPHRRASALLRIILYSICADPFFPEGDLQCLGEDFLRILIRIVHRAVFPICSLWNIPDPKVHLRGPDRVKTI